MSGAKNDGGAQGRRRAQRILEAAGDAVPPATGSMRSAWTRSCTRAGLTHGGFYAHFASKEALVAEVSAAALARSAARWERISQEAEPAIALERIVGSLPRSGACRRGRTRLRADDARSRDRTAARGAPGSYRLDPRMLDALDALPAGGSGVNARWRHFPAWSARSCWRGCPMIQRWPAHFWTRRRGACWEGKTASWSC